MGNIIGAILLILVGIYLIFWMAHILLDILGVVLIIAAVYLVWKHVSGSRGHARL